MASKAKKKKPRHKNPGGVMGRSDIPYAQRLQLQQSHNINWSREESVRIVMYCWASALHKLKGIGYSRLVRFNNRFREVDAEFYGQEIELSLDRAKRRLGSMGIEISGELMMAPPEKGRTPREMEIMNNVVQAVQCAIICGCMAANDVFGYAEKPLMQIREEVERLTARYSKEGEKFLLEDLEKIGFKIISGHAVGFVDETGKAVRAKS